LVLRLFCLPCDGSGHRCLIGFLWRAYFVFYLMKPFYIVSSKKSMFFQVPCQNSFYHVIA
jgi:hypothetical protein